MAKRKYDRKAEVYQKKLQETVDKIDNDYRNLLR